MIGNVNVPGALAADIANKVDKVTGKGLSSNDFTDAYKSKLDNVDTEVTEDSEDLITSGAVFAALEGASGEDINDIKNLLYPKIAISGLGYPTKFDDNNYDIKVTNTTTGRETVIRTKGESSMTVNVPERGAYTVSAKPVDQIEVTKDVNISSANVYEDLGKTYSCDLGLSAEDLDTVTLSTDLTPLSLARSKLAAASIGDYALFGGGQKASGSTDIVDVYDINYVKSTAPVLRSACYNIAATTIGGYALFVGGMRSNGYGNWNVADAYNQNLTKTLATLATARNELAGAANESYAIFGGGCDWNNTSNASSSYIVEAYNTNLVKTTATSLSASREGLAAANTEDYVIFGGGFGRASNSSTSQCDAYDLNLVRTYSGLTLITPTKYLAATSIGSYALFAGGDGGAKVTAYDNNLLRKQAQDLSNSRQYMAAGSGERAYFLGGYAGTTVRSTIVDGYDENLVRLSAPPLKYGVQQLAACGLGSKVFVAGGNHQTGNDHTDIGIAYERTASTRTPEN